MSGYASQYHHVGKSSEISFKGARIYWKQGEDEDGRRAAQHVYPQRDAAYTEDLGKKPGAYTLEAFSVGEHFKSMAAKFKAACNTPGPGVLVHPLWGQITVVCTECRDRYSTKRGGLIEFHCTFAEQGQNKYPSSDADYQQMAADKAASSLLTFQSSFTSAVNLQGPGWLADAQAADLAVALATLGQVVRIMASPAAAGQVQDGIDQAGNLLTNPPVDPPQVIDTAFNNFGVIYQSDPGGAFNTAQAMLDFGMDVSEYGPGLTPITPATRTRQVQAGQPVQPVQPDQQIRGDPNGAGRPGHELQQPPARPVHARPGGQCPGPGHAKGRRPGR
jgi:hypothetical protein